MNIRRCLQAPPASGSAERRQVPIVSLIRLVLSTELAKKQTMRHNLILTGDINLLGVTDPTIPFARVRDRLQAADVVFANLECCFYEPEGERSLEDEGFYVPLKAAEALTFAGVHAVGNAKPDTAVARIPIGSD
jgi:Bacterial capsule synthesis protein PGA_cap